MDDILIPEIPDEEADREIVTDLKYQIDKNVRGALVDDAARFGKRYQMAMLSCVTGRWDDLIKDVRRGRIRKEQAHLIVRTIDAARLTNDLVSSTMHERIANTDPEICETCAHRSPKATCQRLAAVTGMWFDPSAPSWFGCNEWEMRNPITGWSDGC